jgi:hypothetical protein
LNDLAQERGELDDRETEMRNMVGRAEEKRAWFSSFREWVEGVAGFLDEKVCSFTVNFQNLINIICSTLFSRSWKRNIRLFSKNGST